MQETKWTLIQNTVWKRFRLGWVETEKQLRNVPSERGNSDGHL